MSQSTTENISRLLFSNCLSCEYIKMKQICTLWRWHGSAVSFVSASQISHEIFSFRLASAPPSHLSISFSFGIIAWWTVKLHDIAMEKMSEAFYFRHPITFRIINHFSSSESVNHSVIFFNSPEQNVADSSDDKIE